MTPASISPPTAGSARPTASNTAVSASKITYTSANVDFEQFHRLFDEGLARTRADTGRSYPLYIDGKAVTTSGPPLADRSPIDTRM